MFLKFEDDKIEKWCLNLNINNYSTILKYKNILIFSIEFAQFPMGQIYSWTQNTCVYRFKRVWRQLRAKL